MPVVALSEGSVCTFLWAELREGGIGSKFGAGKLVSSMAVKAASPRMEAFSLRKMPNLAAW